MKVSADVCPLCEGTGWKSVSIGSDRRVTRCDCRRQARTQTLLAAARIPKRYEHCELSNFDFDGAHRQLFPARMAACKFVEEYPVGQHWTDADREHRGRQDPPGGRHHQGTGAQQRALPACSTTTANC